MQEIDLNNEPVIGLLEMSYHQAKMLERCCEMLLKGDNMVSVYRQMDEARREHWRKYYKRKNDLMNKVTYSPSEYKRSPSEPALAGEHRTDKGMMYGMA